MQTTHGAPLCRAGEQASAGTPRDAWPAIAEIQRRLRCADGAEAGGTVARAVLGVWQDGFVVALDRAACGRPSGVVAWWRGGVEELEALVAALAGTALMHCAE